MPTLKQQQYAWLEAGIDTREDYTAAGSGSSGVHTRSSTGLYYNGTDFVGAAVNELRSEEEIEVWYSTDFTTSVEQTITFSALEKGLLLEPQRTNVFPTSNADGYFTETKCTFVTTAATADIINGTDPLLLTLNGGYGFHRVNTTGITLSDSTDYCLSMFVYQTDTPNTMIEMYKDGSNAFGVSFDPVGLTAYPLYKYANTTVNNIGVIKYGSTGWYRVFASFSTASGASSGFYFTATSPTHAQEWNSDGSTIVFAQWQVELGNFPSSPIITSGATATRNADSILHDYDYPVGDDGKTLGFTWSHYYPKAATNVLTTATAAAGEFEATIQTDSSGNLDLSVKDSGASAVTAEHTFATGDEYADRITQLDFESDDQIGFWEDNTQVGSSAAHSIATTDILADGQFTIEGFGGRIHKLAIDDPSGQSGNYSYLQLALPDYNGATALTGSGTLTIAGLTQAIGAAILNGSGTLTIQGLTEAIGAAILNGDGALTVDGLATAFGASVFNGSGTLTAQGLAEAIGAAILTGSGTLTAQGLAEVIGAAALNGSGSLAVDGLTQAIGAAIIASDGNLTVAGIAEAIGAAALNGSGTLTIAGLTEAIGAAILNGSGSLTVAGLTEALGASSFIGEGTLGATGTTVVASSVSISGDGTITVEGVSGITGAAAINGSGTIGVDGLTEALGASSFLGGGIIVGSGITIVAGSVTFEGSGTILPEGITIVTSSVAISGATTIDASGQTVALGTVTIDGSGTLIIDGTTEAIGAAAFDADGTFSINGTILFGGNVIITGSGNLGVDGLTEAIGAVALDAEGNFIVRGRLVSRPPYERIYYISDEDRTYYIAKDDRSFDIENEDRTYEIR